MSHLSPVTLDDLTESDLVMLDKAARNYYRPIALKDLLERVRDDKVQLWRVEDSPARGFFATTLQDGELWLETIVVEGFIKHFWDVHSGCVELAKRLGADRLSGFTKHPGLARLYERQLKLKPVAKLYVETL